MAKVSHDLGKEIADRLSKSTGAERKRIVDNYLSVLKWSESKLRAVAKEHGFISDRKGRKDKGISKVKIDAETVKVGAAMVFGSKRLTDKITMPAWKAIEILGDNGKLQEEISRHGSTGSSERGGYLGKISKKPHRPYPLPAVTQTMYIRWTFPFVYSTTSRKKARVGRWWIGTCKRLSIRTNRAIGKK